MVLCVVALPFVTTATDKTTLANSVDPDQMPQNALNTGVSIKSNNSKNKQVTLLIGNRTGKIMR